MAARAVPTISHWTTEEVEKRCWPSAEAIARKSEGATDIGTVEVVARERRPRRSSPMPNRTATPIIVMGTGDKRGLQRLVLGSVAA
jgi:nucleotide-binding universal stress UspA family protein